MHGQRRSGGRVHRVALMPLVRGLHVLGLRPAQPETQGEGKGGEAASEARETAPRDAARGHVRCPC